MTMHRRILPMIAAVAGFAAPGAVPAQEPLSEAVYADLNDAVIQHQIVPAHAAFADAAAALAAALDAYCPAPDAEGLAQARAAYHATYDGWMAVAWVDFGPQILFMRPMRVHFWPDSRNTLGRQLAGVLSTPREDLLDPEVLAGASVALQGLPALERLLFEGTPAADDPYACDLALGIAGNVRSIAADLAAAWADGQGAAGLPPDAASLASSLYQAVYAHLELIVTRKIAPAAGNSAEEARPRLAENWRSQRAIRNIAANLEAMLTVIDNGAQTGFADVLRDAAGAPEAADRLVELLQEASAVAGSLTDRPMADLVTDPDGRAALMELAAAVDTAREIWAREAGDALGVTIGFNSLDGD